MGASETTKVSTLEPSTAEHLPGSIDTRLMRATRQPEESAASHVLAAHQFVRRYATRNLSADTTDLLSNLFIRRFALYAIEAIGPDEMAMVLDPTVNRNRRAFYFRGCAGQNSFGFERSAAQKTIEKARDFGWVAALAPGADVVGGADFGTLAVVRHDPLSPSERAHLELLATALADTLASLLRVQLDFALRRAAQNVRAQLAKDARPGSVVSKAVDQYGTATKADAAFYASICEATWNREYSMVGKGVTYFQAKVRSIDPSLLILLSQKDVFVWDSPISLPGLSKLRPRDHRSTQRPATDFSYVVVPVRDLGELVGAFVFAFLASRSVGRLVAASALAHQLQVTRTSARYLFQRRYTKLIVEPIYRGRETRVETGKCAVLMPFTADWSDRVWSHYIAPTITSAGFKPTRADDLYGSDVMEDIWSMILSSEIVVADITGRNANVFYELGVAHTLGKRVVLLTQSVADIPFDLNRYRHVIYGDNHDGYESLTRGLLAALADAAARR